MLQKLKKSIAFALVTLGLTMVAFLPLAVPSNGGTCALTECVSAAPDPAAGTENPTNSRYYCGSGDTKTYTAINLGCSHKGNAIMDALFAIIRFLSTGVGIVLVGSMVYAGIQYTMSRDDPQAVATARGRIQANIWALLIFIFAYAILNYLIPGQFLK